MSLTLFSAVINRLHQFERLRLDPVGALVRKRRLSRSFTGCRRICSIDSSQRLYSRSLWTRPPLFDAAVATPSVFCYSRTTLSYPCHAQCRHLHRSPQTFSRSHYDVLGVSSTATQSEIKDAFYRLSKELHPDRNPDSPDTIEKFKRLAAAYEVVGNPEQRRRYDGEFKPGMGQRRGGGNDSYDHSFDDQSGPGFSTVKGDKWRGKYDKSAGFRKTSHDEAFDRWMRDVDERRGYSDARRQRFDQRKWDEWYENHYQDKQHQHPFWEQERRRREEQWGQQEQQQQQQQPQSDERSGKHTQREPHRIVYERNFSYRFHPRPFLRIVIIWTLITWIVYSLQESRNNHREPRYFSPEPAEAVNRDEFIRLYYEKLAKEETNFDQREPSDQKPPPGPSPH